MFRVRYFLKLIIAYISRFKALILMGFFIGGFAFLTVNLLGKFFWNKNVEKIGVTGRFAPQNAPKFILSQVTSGLTFLDDSGTAIPDLAESWETPDKGRTWLFELKDGLLWQDGSEVTAQTLNYAFSDSKVEIVDKKTISFSLEHEYSAYPSIMAKPVFKKGFLGTGDWKAVKVSLQGSFLQEMVLQNEKGDKKIFRFFPTYEQSKTAFKLGKIDKIIDLHDPAPFSSWKNTTVSAEPNTRQVATIFFNTKDPLLSDKTVRQALAYAIEKKVLGTRALGPMNPFSWAYNPQVKSYDYDSNRAKQIVSELADEIKDKLEIKLITSPLLLESSEKIAKDWQNVGVKTILQVSSVVPENFQAYLTILEVPDDPDQYSLWHSTQEETNISKYTNPRIDKLLEDGRIELDIEERKKIYLDFQRFLLEDLPAVFLYHPVYYTVTRK